jgi:hypothetical protein
MLHLSRSQKYLGLLLTTLLIAAGVIAQNKFTGYLADKNKICQKKTIAKTDQSASIKLALLEDHLIIDKEIKLEDWMFQSDKWKIHHRMEWEKEPTEEPSEIEEWMLHFEPISDHWLKKQNFFIL